MCRPWCRALLPTGISSYLVLACSVVRLRCSVWYLVRGIVLYPLVSSCRLQSVVLPRYSCRSSIVVGRLVVPVACGCLIVPGVATAWPPCVPSGGPTGDHQEGGGSFSKRGERQTETRPVPIFMRKVKKNVVFQRKTGEIQRKTGYEERRKRKVPLTRPRI